VLDEYGFGHHGTGAAGTGEPGDCHQQRQNNDGQIAHGTILATSRHPRNAPECRNSPWTRWCLRIADLLRRIACPPHHPVVIINQRLCLARFGVGASGLVRG
jgi:hypothetical protein